MNNKKSSTDLWDRNRGQIYSTKGGWVIGRGVINQGFDMMEDFVGKLSYMQVVILNATGKMPTRALADWFDAMHICLSWPDPRIWCNHMGALGGTLHAGVVASTMAGILASDSRAYGIKPILEGLGFIQRAMLDKRNGLNATEIVEKECKRNHGKPFVMGYARPITKGDERVGVMLRYSEELQFEIGEHLQLGLEIERAMLERFDESMNINGYLSAFLSDQGFTPEDAYRSFAFLVTSGVTACYTDTRDKTPETFLPQRCEDVIYQGVDARSVPD